MGIGLSSNLSFVTKAQHLWLIFILLVGTVLYRRLLELKTVYSRDGCACWISAIYSCPAHLQNSEKICYRCAI